MAEKRTFVTLQNINAEKKRKLKDRNDDKERRISTRKKLQFNDDVSTHEEELIGLADYIKRFESPDTKAEKVGEGLPDPKAKIVGAGLPDPKAKTVGEELGKCVEGQGCNDYEMKRNDNVAKNKAKLKELGLVPSKSAKSCQKDKGKCKETNEDASESEYVPDNNDVEAEQQSDREDDNVTSKRTKKVKRQRVEIGAGPRTRLQATKLAGSSEKKEATAGATSLPVEVNNAPVVSLKENLKSLREGPGSMALYLELREKQQIEKEIPRAESQTQHLQSQSDDAPVDAAPKRKRGKTKMNHVHNRGEKKRITLNYLKQPVADDGKLLSEFSNFLGTTVRQFVSLTCASWHQVPEKGLLLEYVQDKYIIPEDAVPIGVTKKFRKLQKGIKSHGIKLRRPILLGPRVSPKLPTSCDLKNLRNLKILKKNPIDGDAESDADCEELAKVYDADVYVATRKRKDGREYKLPPEVLKTVKDKVLYPEQELYGEMCPLGLFPNVGVVVTVSQRIPASTSSVLSTFLKSCCESGEVYYAGPKDGNHTFEYETDTISKFLAEGNIKAKEIGRAGRDGRLSFYHLLFDDITYYRLRSLMYSTGDAYNFNTLGVGLICIRLSLAGIRTSGHNEAGKDLAYLRP
ncbi:hypothetical protein POM88_009506 [Heracleum sosnowskyi]|uniref:Uncharacterized protein n=1 Tax=Heracleum sosnowskyi TaxID=360622 RepID=A0AAD8JAR0_9APIA|nr:hypothetical protein POM88_009506 [Heracleum sosnowskyi]